MSFSIEAARSRASNAVFTLGNRMSGKGKSHSDKKPGPDWVEGRCWGGGYWIHPDKLREAIAYYEIAASISQDVNGDFSTYQAALLLEELGDFTRAEQVYQSLSKSEYYAGPAKMGLERCKAWRDGTFNSQKSVDAFMASMTKMIQSPQDPAEQLEGIQNALMNLTRGVLEGFAPSPAPAQDNEQNDEELACETALAFVNLLLDKKYTEAKKMLHPSLSGMKVADLKRPFEALFRGEPFPDTAHAFDAMMDLPQDTHPGDLASVYVTIDSENNEAVNVLVNRENGKLTIREIEWGRP